MALAKFSSALAKFFCMVLAKCSMALARFSMF